MRTADFLIKSELCIGCGACVSLCPVDALKLKIDNKAGIYFPELDEEKCIKCSICYQVCPVSKISFISNGVKEKLCSTFDTLIGNYIRCYIGYATDHEIRYNASSGGLVTQLLIHALESGTINGALVTRMRKDDPLKPEPFIARTREELMEASGSKYCPVPVNLLLRDVLKTEENERFAIVGLPCQIRAVKNAERINKRLQEKIVLHMGLFCNHTPNFLATEIFLQRIGVRKEDITELKYRGEGWPGFMRISLKNGKTVKVALPLYWRFLGLDFFMPRRCLICDDGLNELADLSFGDAWLPKFSKDNLGTSIVIVRTSAGMNLIQNAKELGKIELVEAGYREIIQSQLNMIYFKKINLKARAKLLGMYTPHGLVETKTSDLIFAIFTYLNSQVFSRSSIVKFVLKKVPIGGISIYYFLPKLLYSKALDNFQKRLSVHG